MQEYITWDAIGFAAIWTAIIWVCYYTLKHSAPAEPGEVDEDSVSGFQSPYSGESEPLSRGCVTAIIVYLAIIITALALQLTFGPRHTPPPTPPDSSVSTRPFL